jgi:hypothetical protein
VSDDSEPDKDGWGLLGFLYRVLGDGPRFWRLIALLVVLMVAYSLAKGDLTTGYEHLTRHDPEWARLGIPPGSISVVLGAMKYFSRRREVRRREHAVEAKELPRDRRTAESVPEQAADQQDNRLGEPGGRHAKNGGASDPDHDSRPADDTR